MQGNRIDNLVLGTVNAPWTRAIDAATLAGCLKAGEPGPWLPHLSVLMQEVAPHLVIGFAAAHGVSRAELARAYELVAVASGTRNQALEAAIAGLAKAA